MFPVTVAIDGPAGAGKSTVAQAVAKRLGFLYIDSGAMYRAVAYLCLQHSVAPDQADGVAKLLEKHDLRFTLGPENMVEVSIDGQDVTDGLRRPEVSKSVSTIAALANVREKLTKLQRDFSNHHSVVMDGRDIGTVVLPNASVKIFLTADVTERASRRKAELEERGFDVSLEELAASVQQRDRQDEERQVAPLRKAEDAILIDSTGMSIEDVVSEILQLVEHRHVHSHD